MKCFLASAMIFVPTIIFALPLPLRAQPVKAQWLYSQCTDKPIDSVKDLICAAFIAGYVQGDDSITLGDDRTVGEFNKSLIWWMKENPSKWAGLDVTTAIRRFVQEWWNPVGLKAK